MKEQIKAIFLDISGVLVNGDTPIPGAKEAITLLRNTPLVLRIVTNTATQSSAEIIKKLAKAGFTITPDELITAPSAAKAYLIKKQLRPYCLIHSALKPEFSDINQQNPNAVLLGDARDDLSYDNLNQAFRLCRSGAPLIGIGLNKYFSDGENLCLDSGMYIKGMEWATGMPAIIMGKPSQDFFTQVVASTNFHASQCLMVGDDVESDVQGALDSGLMACLVRTGKYQARDEDKLSSNAIVFDDIMEVVRFLVMENNII